MGHNQKSKFKVLVVGALLTVATTACFVGSLADAAEPGSSAGLDLTNAPAPPTSPGSFFSQAVGYFSSFNTNLDSTFGANRGTVWTSVDAIQGGSASLANSIGISYDVYRGSQGTNQGSVFGVSVENVMRNGGVTGTVISEGVGLSLGFTLHDVKLMGYLDGVYSFAETSDKIGVEFGLRVMKALGAHTFAGVGLGYQLPGNRQIFSGFVGFTF